MFGASLSRWGQALFPEKRKEKEKKKASAGFFVFLRPCVVELEPETQIQPSMKLDFLCTMELTIQCSSKTKKFTSIQ